jgi:divalent metal cation (Fe/Co/Zn/Cd) transporter
MTLDGPTIIGLRRKALLLVWAGLLWNIVEAAVALWSGIGASSVALLAFGLDSFIELFAGAVLIWHLGKEWKGQQENQEAEERAHKLVGITFVILSLFIAAQAGATLLGWLSEPNESFVGIALVTVSAVIMFALYVSKSSIATKLGSPALRAEAVESLVCDLQDVTLLIGLGFNALFGWWWTDPVAALALIPFLLNEAREAFSSEEEEEPEEASVAELE